MTLAIYMGLSTSACGTLALYIILQQHIVIKRLKENLNDIRGNGKKPELQTSDEYFS